MRLKRAIFTLAAVCLVIFSIRSFSFAQTSTPTPQTLLQKQAEIKDLQNKIVDLQGQGKSLSTQIAVMDSQIRLTELRIDATEQEMQDLSKDISIATGKIGDLEKELTQLTKVSVNRIVATYEIGNVQPLQMLFSSGGISDFLFRLNYLRITQASDKQLLLTTQQAKNDYENQKGIFEDKKIKVESLRKQLVAYTVQLDRDKKDKEFLLASTKNSEKEYQRRLADALRELGQIQKAAQFLITTDPKDVGRGDVIGLMGNTGYSSGPHLHFGVYNISKLEDYSYYSSYEDPAHVLERRNVKWGTGCAGENENRDTGSGSFGWPMDNITYISQGFGTTCWSWMYSGNPHPAYDIVGPLNSVVKAVESGKAYICRNCTGDGGNGVFILHNNGKMTLYWHLQ